jgi:hypothetical protein
MQPSARRAFTSVWTDGGRSTAACVTLTRASAATMRMMRSTAVRAWVPGRRRGSVRTVEAEVDQLAHDRRAVDALKFGELGDFFHLFGGKSDGHYRLASHPRSAAFASSGMRNFRIRKSGPKSGRVTDFGKALVRGTPNVPRIPPALPGVAVAV